MIDFDHIICILPAMPRVAQHDIDQRREAMTVLLRDQAYLPVGDLCRRFNISEATARRDLVALSRHKSVVRTFGGAMARGRAHRLREFDETFTSFRSRRRVAVLAKNTIARQAMRLIRPGQTVFLDAGTTLFQLAEEIAAHPPAPLTIVTQSLMIAALLASVEGLNVHLLGGRVLARQGLALGTATEAAARKLRFDLALLGAEALNVEGIWNSQEDVVALQRAVMARSNRSCFLLDATKIGKSAPCARDDPRAGACSPPAVPDRRRSRHATATRHRMTMVHPATPPREQLIALSRDLGREDRKLAILGEGNTSTRVSAETFLVKASGTSLSTMRPEDVTECRFAPLLELLDKSHVSDAEIGAVLMESRVDSTSKRPSTEAVFHAYLLSLPGIHWVAHTHPIAVNGIACSPRANDFADRRMFPDEIVCCGQHSLLIPYVDPGVPLAQQLKMRSEAFQEKYGELPRVILLQNHGLIAPASSVAGALSATLMAVKAAEIFSLAAHHGGPVFLDSTGVGRIESRGDEHYRRQQLGI